ncbi:phenylacetyl-ligase [Moniliophthora roreri]|nr:phenylacetyl-ligase [Moniliophthora roreri]
MASWVYGDSQVTGRHRQPHERARFLKYFPRLRLECYFSEPDVRLTDTKTLCIDLGCMGLPRIFWMLGYRSRGFLFDGIEFVRGARKKATASLQPFFGDLALLWQRTGLFSPWNAFPTEKKTPLIHCILSTPLSLGPASALRLHRFNISLQSTVQHVL